MPERIAGELLAAASRLRHELRGLRFGPPVSHVYDPLDYARRGYESYVRAFANAPKRVLFVGMNPGPVRDGADRRAVRRRPDGARLAAASRRRSAGRRPSTRSDRCRASRVRAARSAAPASGAPSRSASASRSASSPTTSSRTTARSRSSRRAAAIARPTSCPSASARRCFAPATRTCAGWCAALEPEWVIGIGAFAEARAREALPGARVGRITHPSPANPRAQENWGGAGAATSWPRSGSGPLAGGEHETECGWRALALALAAIALSAATRAPTRTGRRPGDAPSPRRARSRRRRAPRRTSCSSSETAWAISTVTAARILDGQLRGQTRRGEPARVRAPALRRALQDLQHEPAGAGVVRHDDRDHHRLEDDAPACSPSTRACRSAITAR